MRTAGGPVASQGRAPRPHASRPTITLDGDRLAIETGSVVIELVDEKTANPDRSLTGVRWNLTTIIDGDEGTASSVGVEAWIELSENGSLSAGLGCNDGRAGFTVTGDKLDIGPLASTKIACPGEGDRVEAAVVAVLGASPTFQIDADRLSLRVPGAGLDFVAAG